MDILPTPRRFGRSGARARKVDADQVIDLTEPAQRPEPALVLPPELVPEH